MVGCCFLALGTPSPGEGPQAAAAGAPSLEKIVEGLQNGADSLQKKTKELLAAIDSEASAKRISEPVAQGLRWNLRNLASAVGPASNGKADISAQLATANLPMDNAAIAQAARELQEAANAARTEGTELLRQADRAAESRCSELVGHATSAAEVDALIAILERLRSLGSAQPGYYLGNKLEKCITVTHYLRDCFDLTPSSDPESVKRVLMGLAPMHMQGMDFGKESDYAERVARVLAPFKKASEDAQKNLDAALEERKPSKEAYAALAALEGAETRFTGAASYTGITSRNPIAEVNGYRRLCEILGAMEQHRWLNARAQVREARQSISQLQNSAGRKETLNGFLEKWEHEIGEGEAADARQFHDHLHAALAEVKKPSELGPIVRELQLRERDAEERSTSRYPQGRGLAAQLSILAAAWENDDLNLLANQAFAENGAIQGQEDPSVGEILAGLRGRAEREILSRTLKSPNLLQEPLAGQPLGQALDGLLEKFRSEGEWHRALQLMENQAALAPARGPAPRPAEAILAVRSYLVGQNFELAEVWTDAAAAYKMVLAIAVDGTPVKEAAERLKALAKDHPEAVKAARPWPSQGPLLNPRGNEQ
jgi:hypothetical protein